MIWLQDLKIEHAIKQTNGGAIKNSGIADHSVALKQVTTICLKQIIQPLAS